MGNPMRDDPRLARPRARENEERALGLENSVLLFRSEACEETH
jgi:hypothetical protein